MGMKIMFIIDLAKLFEKCKTITSDKTISSGIVIYSEKRSNNY
jgi:hypothetical protein